MNNKRPILNDKTLIPIESICRGEAGYTINNGNFNIRRNWAKTGTVQEIEFKELKIAINEPGVREQFETYNKDFDRTEVNALLIKNAEVREKLGLIQLDKYVLDKDQIKDLLLNQPLKVLEDMIKNCSDSVLDNIIQISIELPLKDMNKISLLESYSEKKIKDYIESKEPKKEPIQKRGRPIVATRSKK